MKAESQQQPDTAKVSEKPSAGHGAIAEKLRVQSDRRNQKTTCSAIETHKFLVLDSIGWVSAFQVVCF